MTDNTTETTTTDVQRHRSGMMAISALAALLVSAWCLAGGPTVSESTNVPWLLLTIGVLVGVGLIVSGFLRK